VAGLWILENLLSLLRYGRLSSFHTYLSKAAAYALGFFLGWLFLFGFVQPVMLAAVAVAVLASLEELALLALLPRWRSNVRGLWWVWRSLASASR
jgi:CDP-diacylglycerol--glycerol-3-phosphate 3-phosphatidyltransferase